MLHVTKLAPGQQRYYLATATSREEGGEGAGVWIGGGAARLGLAGPVGPAELAELLTPALPPPERRVTPPTVRPRRNPGFDLTFAAPKSVSIVAGLGSPATTAGVEAAHRAAVAAAIGYLERDAARAVRAGRPIPVEGLVGAGFGHSTSRLGDPHTHTHVLIANLVLAGGRWSALDARGLYLHAAAAGALYHAHLRFELGQRLGLTFGPVIYGVAQVRGVSVSVQRAFSRRRAEVEAALVARGAWSARAAEVAALSTRAGKGPSSAGQRDERRAEWKRRAGRLGLGERELVLLQAGRAMALPTAAELDGQAAEVLGGRGVTGEASTFSRRDVVRAWCDRLPGGLPVAAIEALAAASLSRADVITVAGLAARRTDTLRLPGGRLIPGSLGEPRYTTGEMRVLESGLVAAASARAVGWPAASAGAVQRALAERPALGAAEAAAVARVGSSGRGVVLLEARAGADRLGLLDALRAAWRLDGLPVAGVSAEARGGAELAAFAGIEPPRGRSLPPHSVLVVDHADRLGTRELARWIDAAGRARATAVLLATRDGPDRRDRAGGWRALRSHLEVAVVRPAPALDSAAAPGARAVPVAVRVMPAPDGLVVLAGTGADLRERLVGDWLAARRQGQSAVMVAARRGEADRLNRAARERLSRAGDLQGPEWSMGGREWRAGDLVLARRNDRVLGVRAGDRFTVAGLGAGGMAVAPGGAGGGGRLTLPEGYISAGNLVHGYALTVYDAQFLPAGSHLFLAGPDHLLVLAGGAGLAGRAATIHRYVVDTGLGRDRSRAREIAARGWARPGPALEGPVLEGPVLEGPAVEGRVLGRVRRAGHPLSR